MRAQQFLHISRLIMLACLLIVIPPSAGSVADEVPRHSDQSPLMPVYHIPLRVHLAGSSRSFQDFIAVFGEINHIWLSQAGIYFDIEVVLRDQRLDHGLDMYFSPDIGEFNGYYDGEVIQMRDHPRLRPAAHPARSAAGRTAAHELGHALSLPHRQDSDDNLMRSKTLGWQLSAEEIKTARKAARLFLFPRPPDPAGVNPVSLKTLETKRPASGWKMPKKAQIVGKRPLTF